MSIKTHKINSDPRLSTSLVDSKTFTKNPLVVIDVGSLGGFEEHWSIYKNQIKLIGFEPGEDSKGDYYPVALDQKKGTRILHLVNHRPSSSFYRPNDKFKRFPDYSNAGFKIKKIVKTIDLDTFSKIEKLRDVDFIKLDAEGSEFDVLKGAKSKLKDSVLGLSIEVVFDQWSRAQDTFGVVDDFLKQYGFVLHDLILFRHAKKILSPQMFYKYPGPTEYGQVTWGQALYFKDAVPEIRDKKLAKKWSENNILKLASLMEIYNLPDCSAELIKTGYEKGLLKGYNYKKLLNLLTPRVNNRIVSYEEYIQYLKKTTRKYKPSKK